MDDAEGVVVNTHPIAGEDDGFKIKGAATRGTSADRKRTKAADNCTICLQPITERAVTVPCNHVNFDFICLVSWLQHRDSCPLCNAVITAVEYDWQGPNDYKSYHVQTPETAQSEKRLTQHVRRFEARHEGRPGVESAQAARQLEDRVLVFRRRIYQRRLYSLHVGSNSMSQYRDFTTQQFANSAPMQSRARAFLRRELHLFSLLDSNGRIRNREFVLEYIVAVLKKCEIKGADGRAEDFVAEFLERSNANLLLHELQTWLRSPYARLDEWDKNVQYPDDSANTAQTKGR